MNTDDYLVSLRSRVADGFDIWDDISLSDFLDDDNRETDMEIVKLLSDFQLPMEAYKFTETPEGAQDGILRASIQVEGNHFGLGDDFLEVFFSKYDRLVSTNLEVPIDSNGSIDRKKFKDTLRYWNFQYLGSVSQLEKLNQEEDWFNFFFSCYS